MGLFHEPSARWRIADSLMRFAEARRWKPEDWRVYMRGESDWDYIHVVLVARDFEGKPQHDIYTGVWDHLRMDLADRPDLLSSIGLVVKDFRQAEDRGIFGIGPEYTLEAIPSRS